MSSPTTGSVGVPRRSISSIKRGCSHPRVRNGWRWVYANYNVTARKMTCRDARGISRLFYKGILRTPRPGHPYYWRGFKVRSKNCGYECTDVRLSNASTGGVVRWQSLA
jgi:hypothetical protein